MKKIINIILVFSIAMIMTSCYNDNVYYKDSSHTILKVNDSTYIDVPNSEFKVARIMYTYK